MKKLGIAIITGMALAVLFNATLMEAGTPVTAKLNYQGRLTDSNGVPIADGNYNMIFQIYDADVAGASVWGPETHTGVAVEDGLFSVNLGGGTPTPVTLSGIDFNKDCWLQTTVGATTYTPRQLLTAVTYALFALSAPSGSIDHGALTGLGDDDHTQYFALSQSETVTGIPAFNGGTSGSSSPFTVDSDQKVVNLNADHLDNFSEEYFFKLADNETVTGTPAFNGGTTGSSAPFTADSTFLVTNLNADLLDGVHAASFMLDGCTDCINATEIEDIYVFNNSDTMSGSLGIGTTLSVGTSATVGTTLGVTGAITGASTVQGTQLISTIVTGTKPLNVASTTMVDNLNADMTDGYHASTAQANSTLVARDANGYTFHNWINTISGSAGTTAIDKIYGTYASDNYLRYYTPANFVTVMQPYIDDAFVLKAGDTMTGRLGQSSSGFHGVSKNDLTTRTDSGFFQTDTATIAEGWPADSNAWYQLLTSTHTNDANYYSMQFAASFYNSNDLFYRQTSCGTPTGCATAWNRIWHSGNDGTGSGLDADLLDGYHLSTTRNSANTVPVRDASGYLQLGWINTTSGNATTTAPTKVYASNDDYIRYYTPAQFMTHMAAGGNVCRWGTNVKSIDATYGDTDTCPAGYCAITMVNTGNTNVYPEGGATGRGSSPQHSGDAKLLCCRCLL